MGATGREWSDMRDLAKVRLGPFQTHFTTGPGDATRLTRRALEQGAELIVCVGGDGTFNEVINGLMRETGFHEIQQRCFIDACLTRSGGLAKFSIDDI